MSAAVARTRVRVWDAGKWDSKKRRPPARRMSLLGSPNEAQSRNLRLSGDQTGPQSGGVDSLDAHDLVARLRPAHDADPRWRHAHAGRDQPTEGVIGAAVDGRRCDAHGVSPVGAVGDLLPPRARGQADADVDVLADAAMLARAGAAAWSADVGGAAPREGGPPRHAASANAPARRREGS